MEAVDSTAPAPPNTFRIARWFRELVRDLEQAGPGPRLRFRVWVLVPLSLLAAGTLLARLTGIDMWAESAIYHAGGNSWKLGNHPFWQGLYRFGTIPATIVVLAALAGFALTWYRASFRPWRRVFAFIVLCGVVGPGIVANAALKEYWGRPRPREVEGLGGHSTFEPILTLDPLSKGKSFPCGHATMGFYFVAGFFLFRRHRRGLAEGFLLGGLVVGGLMGVARMAQGGHFFSDVIWAAAICYFSALGLYYALRLDRSLVTRGLRETRMPLWLKGAIALLVLGLLTAVILASPYRAPRNYYILNDFAKEGPLDIHLVLMVGEVEIVPGDEFRITGEAWGHGLPTSQIGVHYTEWEHEDRSEIFYKERLSGRLTEVSQQLKIEVPWERVRKLKIEGGDSRVWMELGEVSERPVVHLLSGEGTISVRAHGQAVKVTGNARAVEEGAVFPDPERGEGGYRLQIEDGFEGRIVAEEEPSR